MAMLGVRLPAIGLLAGVLACGSLVGAVACGGPVAPTAHVAPARGMPVIVDTDMASVTLDSFRLVIGKLLHGRTFADVQAVIRRGTATRVPAWFKVAASIPAAPYAQPAWGVTLGPGRYALVCQRIRDGALSALTTVVIR